MRLTTFACLVIILLSSIANAEVNKRHEVYKELYEVRFDELEDQVHEIKYNLINEINNQVYIIKEQEKEIVDLKSIIQDLEHNLFQTTQSLRNLELEVWDMKESSNSYQAPGCQELDATANEKE